MGSLLVI